MRKGFTLIELLVYMIIMGFIIVVAGRVFSDSTAMRVRSQNMVKSMEDAGKLASLIKEDISQLGTKTWAGEVSSGSDGQRYEIGIKKEVAEEVYQNYNDNPNDVNADFSSYYLERDGLFDDILFQKVYYDDDGLYKAVQEIHWFTENREGSGLRVLKRACETIIGEADGSCSGSAIDMAKDVAKFKLLPSKPGTRNLEPKSTCMAVDACHKDAFMFQKEDFVLSPRTGYPTADLEKTTNGYILKNFPKAKKDISGENASESSGQYYLRKAGSDGCAFSFKPGETYAIEFRIPYDKEVDIIPCDKKNDRCKYNIMASYFRPGIDHLSIGLRKDGKYIGVPDFLFYPPQDKSSPEKCSFEFGVPGQIDDDPIEACVTLTTAIYSEKAIAGQITIQDLEVYRKLDRAYYFDDDEENYNPGENGAHFKEKAYVKAFKLDLEIDKKGEISKSSMVIPVPNNGIFVKAGEN